MSKTAVSKVNYNVAAAQESVDNSNRNHDYTAPSSDRVKVPSSPIYDRQSNGNQGESMPSVPNDENRGRYDSSRNDGRDMHRDDDGQHSRSR